MCVQSVCVFTMFLKFGTGGSDASGVLKHTSSNTRGDVSKRDVVLNDGYSVLLYYLRYTIIFTVTI